MRAMSLNDDLDRTRQDIEQLKNEIETAKSTERRKLRQRLMELQILQLWRITKSENEQRDRDIQGKIDAQFSAALTEHAKVMQTAQDRVDRIKAYLDAGDLVGLREFIRTEAEKLTSFN